MVSPYGFITLAELEKKYIMMVLELFGNKRIAAQVLDIDVTTLHRKLEKWKREARRGDDPQNAKCDAP